MAVLLLAGGAQSAPQSRRLLQQPTSTRHLLVSDLLVFCIFCLYQPTTCKSSQTLQCICFDAYLLTCLRVLQAGGYSSPSVYGYGYGYSSPAAPAATPLFGKLYSFLLCLLHPMPSSMERCNTLLTCCLLLQAHLHAPTAAQLQSLPHTVLQPWPHHLTTALLPSRAPLLHLCTTLQLQSQLHQLHTTHPQHLWQHPNLPLLFLLLPSSVQAHLLLLTLPSL